MLVGLAAGFLCILFAVVMVDRARRRRGTHPTLDDLSSRLLANWLPVTALGLLGVVVSAYVAASPQGQLFKLLLLLIVLGVSLALTPQAFIAGSLLLVAVSTSISAPLVSGLPVSIYTSDLIVILIFVRGLLPRDRLPPSRALAGAPAAIFGFWVLVMAIAAARGMNAGVPLASAVRGESAVLYWPLLYFGFTRILREREFQAPLLARDLAFVALGLAGWMFLARIINYPFHDSGLALVPTGESSYVQRNYGFAGAFIVYPVLALVGIAGMAHGRHNSVRFAILASVGTFATLLTFVRGEIFSLALAAVLILWLRPRSISRSKRGRTALQLSLAVLAALSTLMAVSPKLGDAIVQRAVPFTHQAQGAELNAKYRETAVHTGLRIARSHPGGLGVLDIRRLDAEQIDPRFLAHSGIAVLLLFGGWPALVSALLVILVVLQRSFGAPSLIPWLHPALVATLVMLCAYSIGAAGLAGDPWVIPLGALAIAVRFNLPLLALPDNPPHVLDQRRSPQ